MVGRRGSSDICPLLAQMTVPTSVVGGMLRGQFSQTAELEALGVGYFFSNFEIIVRPTRNPPLLYRSCWWQLLES